MRKMFLLFTLMILGCSDESSARRTLHKAGYTDVQITGYDPFECGDDDSFHTGFIAKNPRGETVSGTVCCGWMTKGCTIRF